MDRAASRKSQHWKWGIVLTLLFVAFELGVYIIHLGNTDTWPQTDCTVVGSRVVRDDLQDQFRFTVMYRGEYRLRYMVGGHEYFVWARSGWKDVDQHVVRAKLDAATDRCDFRVRYNPTRPSDAIAIHK